MRFRRVLPSLAAVFAFALLGVSALFLRESLEEPKATMTTSTEIIEADQTPNETAPPNELNMPVDLYPVVSRPLFSPSRRIPEQDGIPEIVEQVPEAPTPEVVVQPPLTPPKIAMIGILEDDGSLMALTKARDGTEQWVNYGAEIEGWRVVAITPQSITLQLNGESVDIYAVE